MILKIKKVFVTKIVNIYIVERLNRKYFTIVDKQSLPRRLWLLCRKGSLSCHTCCDMRLWFQRSRLRNHPISFFVRQARDKLKIYSYQHEYISFYKQETGKFINCAWHCLSWSIFFLFHNLMLFECKIIFNDITYDNNDMS